MKKIISAYKERLIDISSRNRSLVLKKIYKKRSFDLFRLVDMENIDEKALVDFLINRDNKILILDDPYETKRKEINALESKLEEQRNLDIQKIKTKKDNITVEELKNIDDKLEEIRVKELDRIDKKMEKMLDYSVSLSYLQREIISNERETGLYELYVGYPFVEGIFKDHTFVKAPLLLFPVRMISKDNCWRLENITEQEILLNKVFILGYSKYNETAIGNFETEFSSLEQFGEAVIAGVIEYIKENGIKVYGSNNHSLEKFVDHTNDNIPKYNPGEIVIKNYLVLGQFPISNSIYNDYIELENKNLERSLLKNLLVNDSKLDENTERPTDEDKKTSISEKDMFFLSSLDYSQEVAVNRVSKSKQLVIYGPPGTGKSQTITNIISNSLAKNQRVLMVSQKRAALDVIYNRLSNIQSKVVLIHDANKDKKEFYNKVALEIERIESESTNCDERGIHDRATRIDDEVKHLENIAFTFNRERSYGLTLQQMYAKSKAIENKEDVRFEQFKKFKLNSKLTNISYEMVKKSVEHIKSSGIEKSYRKHGLLLNGNKYLKKLKSNYDFIQAEEVLDKLCQLNEDWDKNAIAKYNNLIFQLYINKNFNVEDTEILLLADKLNEEINGSLLKKLNDGKWWSLAYWMNYSKSKSLQKQNAIDFEKEKQEYRESFRTCNNSIKEYIGNFNVLKNVLKDEAYSELLRSLFDKNDIRNMTSEIQAAMSKHDEFSSLEYSLKELSDVEEAILEHCFHCCADEVEYLSVIDNVLEFSILAQIMDIEKDAEDMGSLKKYTLYSDITRNVSKLMKEKNALTTNLIKSKWDSHLICVKETGAFREYKRQASKKRMLWPIRRYLSEYNEFALRTFPCWLLSPETVSDIFPLAEGLFDIVIFDEASQMFVENTMPTIFRGKQVVIAGDDKQLKPSSTFKAKFENPEDEELEAENSAALEEESLLDLAKVNFDSVHLNYHYRSKYDELINFSNYAFYNGRLQVSPNIIKTSNGNPPIRRIMVNGAWIDRKNMVEAEKVVELISGIFKKRKNNETIGVITFNTSQKDLIEDLLEMKAATDPVFKDAYLKEIDRKDGNEDVSLFVKNIENVQGDERDIIIFSIGYAPNENGKVSIMFGSLSADGGENRLNVAISRAKRSVVVVTSIEPEELHVEDTKNIGPKLLKKYLQYCREVSSCNYTNANAILNSLLDSSINRNTEKKYDSDFEIEVYNELAKRGHMIDTQVGVSGYKIDLGLYDKESSRYFLGIECDGATYHSSKNARERDIHRQRYLESRGWKIARIWSRDWWKNPKAEIDKIETLMKSMNLMSSVAAESLHLDNAYEKKDSSKKSVDTVMEQNAIYEKKSIESHGVASNNSRPQSNLLITVGYGDTVSLVDVATNDSFEISLERNPANRSVMKEIETRVLGLQLKQVFSYNGARYEVAGIAKRDYLS